MFWKENTFNAYASHELEDHEFQKKYHARLYAMRVNITDYEIYFFIIYFCTIIKILLFGTQGNATTDNLFYFLSDAILRSKKIMNLINVLICACLILAFYIHMLYGDRIDAFTELTTTIYICLSLIICDVSLFALTKDVNPALTGFMCFIWFFFLYMFYYNYIKARVNQDNKQKNKARNKLYRERYDPFDFSINWIDTFKIWFFDIQMEWYKCCNNKRYKKILLKNKSDNRFIESAKKIESNKNFDIDITDVVYKVYTNKLVDQGDTQKYQSSKHHMLQIAKVVLKIFFNFFAIYAIAPFVSTAILSKSESRIYRNLEKSETVFYSTQELQRY